MEKGEIKKSIAYTITDNLGCGDEYQSAIGSRLLQIIGELMNKYKCGIGDILDMLVYDELDRCICGNADLQNRKHIQVMKHIGIGYELELYFYKGYFANKEILDLDDLETGLDSFKQCFDIDYDNYADDYENELYIGNDIF